jgi:hypothetical protein
MGNLSFLLMGATLAIVSIAAITYSVSDLRNTSVKRHAFFKSIRLFIFMYLLPVFLFVLGLNIKTLVQLDYITLEHGLKPFIYILSAVLNIIIIMIFIYKPVTKGISMFRRQNRDNSKYIKAISKSRNGMILILVTLVLTIFLNK